jgi:hypothetical protein
MYEPRYHLIDRSLDLVVASAKTFTEIMDYYESKRFSDQYYIFDTLTQTRLFYKYIYWAERTLKQKIR